MIGALKGRRRVRGLKKIICAGAGRVKEGACLFKIVHSLSIFWSLSERVAMWSNLLLFKIPQESKPREIECSDSLVEI